MAHLMNTSFLLHWMPYNLIETDNDISVEWIYFAEIRMLEPFFEDTILKTRSHPYNSNGFKVVTSLQTFLDWSEHINTTALLGFIYHVSRCGSTLLCQLFSLSPENIVVSEAPILDQILQSKVLDVEIKKKTFVAALNFLGQKRFPNEQHLIVKLDSWHLFYADLIREICPSLPFIFLYRSPEEVIKSHHKMRGMQMVPNLVLPEKFGVCVHDLEKMTFDDYTAMVLEKYFDQMDAYSDTDKNVFLCNYAQGMDFLFLEISEKIDLKIESRVTSKLQERLSRYSKDSSVTFTGDQDASLTFLGSFNPLEKYNRLEDKRRSLYPLE